MTTIFKREIGSYFHGMIGYVLTAFLLGGYRAVFFGAEPGVRSAGLWVLYFVQFAVCAVGICAGAGYAQPGGGASQPHRSASAHQSGVSVGDRTGQISGHVCRLCAALPGGCGHDPGPAGTGWFQCVPGIQFGCAAVLFSFGLCGVGGRGVLFQPDRKSDHCSGRLLWRSAAGLPDAGLRSMFSAGSAAALVVFAGLAALFSLGVGLRSKSLLAGCISFAVLCLGLSALFWFRSAWLIEAFSAVLEALCLFVPFESFVNGVFSVPSVVYYLTVSALFLFFTVQVLDRRRWTERGGVCI